MKRVLPLMLLAASVGCQPSEPGDKPAGTSPSSVESGSMTGPGSESPPILFAKDEEPVDPFVERAAEVKSRFEKQVEPLLAKYCVRCHGEKKIESGIRVDRLDGGLDDRWLPLWKGIRRQVTGQVMPPEDEPLLPQIKRKKMIVRLQAVLRHMLITPTCS